MKKHTKGKFFTYPSVVPIISSACEEMISAIIWSFIASFSFFHLRPPGKIIGRSCGCNPRKFLALFCLVTRSSVTFCFNSAVNSVLASTGSCYFYFIFSSFWNVFFCAIFFKLYMRRWLKIIIKYFDSSNDECEWCMIEKMQRKVMKKKRKNN